MKTMHPLGIKMLSSLIGFLVASEILLETVLYQHLF